MNATAIAQSHVRDFMRAPVTKVATDTPAAEVLALLETRSISSVPVVLDDVLVGIVSTTDLVKFGYTRGNSLIQAMGATAKDLMNHPVVTVTADDNVHDAARKMIERRIHRVVVVDGNRPIGVLSARDVLTEVRRLRIQAPVYEFMSKDPKQIDLGATIDQAIDALTDANVHGLVVVDGSSPVGVFTHSEALYARKLPKNLRERPVEEVMSYEFLSLDKSTPLSRAAAYAQSMGVRRFLVTAEHKMIGIASCLDLVRAVI